MDSDDSLDFDWDVLELDEDLLSILMTMVPNPTDLHRPFLPQHFQSLLNSIEEGVNVKERLSGNTPLHLNESMENCKMLIDNGADVNCPNMEGSTPLHLCKSAEKCVLLIQSAANINATDNQGRTPLHLCQTVETCKELIRSGANINAIDNEGITPLSYAYRSRSEDVIYALIYYGADARILDRSGERLLTKIDLENNSSELVPILYDLTYDEIEEPIPWADLRSMQKYSTEYFNKLIPVCSEVILPKAFHESEGGAFDFLSDLFTFESDNLRLFLDKFKGFVVDILVDVMRMSSLSKKQQLHEEMGGSSVIAVHIFRHISILEDLVDYDDLLERMIGLMPRTFRRFCEQVINLDVASLDGATELILMHLTHGLILSQDFLNSVYTRFGFCDLFRILLHCELCIDEQKRHFCQNPLMIRLFYEVDLSIESCLEDPKIYIDKDSIFGLVEQFALPKLKQYSVSEFEGYQEIQERVKQMPDVPKLLELARNAARLHIIKRFKMKTASQFLTTVDHLDINQVYKDVLTFKIKLYE